MLGYPATLLLLCVLDALGHWLKVGTGHTRLEVLNHPSFNQGLNEDQLKNLTHWYRYLLVHQAAMAPKSFLSPEDGAPFQVSPNGELNMIRVKPLYDLVSKAWNGLRPTYAPTLDPNMKVPTVSPITSLTPIVSGTP